MPDIEISKIKVRRGTDVQRKLITFDQGELAYTLDTKRLFIGNGATLGGDIVGNKTHPPLLNFYSLTSLKSEIGDTVSVAGIFYQLVGADYTNPSNWTKYRVKVDPIVFGFDVNDTLLINPNSIIAGKINPTTVSNGIKIDSGRLQLNFNNRSLEISASKLSLKQSGINEREISSTTLSLGLTGGSGAKIKINANPLHFYFKSNQLNLSGFNPFTLRFADMNSLWFGTGLNYNPVLSTISTTLTDVNGDSTILKDGNGEIYINSGIFGDGLVYSNVLAPTLSTKLANVDNTSIINVDGTIKVNDNVVPSTKALAKTTVDVFGRVISQTSSIISALTGNNTLNSNNSLSSIFNGSIVNNIPGLNITRFTAVSSNGTTLTLSSAGFITFDGPTTTQEGQVIRRFAIPIFTY